MTEKDLPVIKYTSGVAIMLSPFFVLAHAIAYLFEILLMVIIPCIGIPFI